jgi:nicotinate-nucleotide pyrophosphorylase (carboxylating)
MAKEAIPMRELPRDLGSQVQTAIREDVGTGDVTAGFVPASQTAHGRVITRESAVLCGRPWVEEVFRQLDESVRLRGHADDGDVVSPAQNLFDIEGNARSILTGERTALNFLQLLSGVATETRRYVDAVAGTGCTILDTRKTIPGLRTAQKYAVTCAGAANHRMGLYDMVLVKENHIAAAGSLTRAVEAARKHVPGLKVEVEVETMTQLEEAIGARPDIIMLDNFDLAEMRKAVAFNRERGRHAKLEASGNVSLDNVREIAATGVDFISVGALTKHVRAVDLSLRLEFNA